LVHRWAARHKFHEDFLKGGTIMRLSIRALAIAVGIMWGGAILIVGAINLVAPSYGMSFLQMTSSIYPWFHAAHGVRSVVIGTVDGFIDGAVGALLLAVLYNSLAVHSHAHTSQPS
jgi:hypothetical protein